MVNRAKMGVVDKVWPIEGDVKVWDLNRAFNWLPICKNIYLDTQNLLKIQKTRFHYVRTRPIIRKNRRGQMGDFPVKILGLMKFEYLDLQKTPK